MDLNQATDPRVAERLPQGLDHALLEGDGPTAHGDKMGTPQADEKLLWKGRPNAALLARSAFHTYSLAAYFAVLIAIALVTGRTDAAMIAAGLGVVLMGILYFLAWLSARTTLYILTDVRLIMRIGMAIETRINVPLKQVKAAHLRPQAKGFGDISLELSGDRLLGVVLLWPHARPWHFNRPQPMLRAIPEVARVAQLMADARAIYGEIDHNLSEIKEAAPQSGQQGHNAAGTRPATGTRIAKPGLGDKGFEGAPA
ncbi:MAG: photosynthetic complex putative assembly protein PuhB [Erythrobacter sp.]